MSFIVRLGEPDDIPRVAEMNRALSAFHGEALNPPEAWIRDVTFGERPHFTIWVAEAEGALIGYGATQRIMRFQNAVEGVDLHHLFIEEPWRGKGVGRAIFDHVVEAAQVAGQSIVLIGTDPNNIAAQETYRSWGMEDAPAPGPRFRLML